jgi:hypothetical protein
MKKGFIITGTISKKTRYARVEKTLKDKVLDFIISLFKPPKEKPVKKVVKKKAEKFDLIGKVVWGIVILFLLSIGYLVWQLFTLVSQLSMYGPGTANISAVLVHSWFANFGSRTHLQNAQILRGWLNSTSWPVYAQIYLLPHPFDPAIYVVREVYPEEDSDFVFLAIGYLSTFRKDFTIHYISVEDLPFLPSGSMVLVMGKYPPRGFFGNLTQNPRFLYVFFVTLEPNYEIDEHGRQTPVNYWSSQRVEFEPADLHSQFFHLSRGLYKVGEPKEIVSSYSQDNWFISTIRNLKSNFVQF